MTVRHHTDFRVDISPPNEEPESLVRHSNYTAKLVTVRLELARFCDRDDFVAVFEELDLGFGDAVEVFGSFEDDVKAFILFEHGMVGGWF